MGIIDTHSKHSLYDVVNGDLGVAEQGRGFKEPEGSVDFYGFHIMPQNDDGEYIVQYDGHIGSIDRIDCNDFDDVLGLVDHLMTHVFEAHHHDYQDDKEGLVEWAGKIMTSDPKRAEEEPELYTHIPDNPSGAEE